MSVYTTEGDRGSATNDAETDGKQSSLYTNQKYAQKSLDPNPMYGQNVENTNSIYPPNDQDPNPVRTHKALDPNPMYSHNDEDTNPPELNPLDPNPMHGENNQNTHLSVRNALDPNPMYAQDTPDSNPMPSQNTELQGPNHDDVCITPYAVAYAKDDDKILVRSRNTHQQRGQTGEAATGNNDIEPYAVAYMCQDDKASAEEAPPNRYEKTASENRNDTSNRLPGSSANPAGSSAMVGNSSNIQQVRQPPNALLPNPMYVRNVAQKPSCGCMFRFINFTATKAILIVMIVIVVILIGVFIPINTKDVQTTVSVNISFGITTLLMDLTPDHTTESYSERMESREIIFGGKGSSPGKFDGNFGVAVSSDSDIFVTDQGNQRVQVFSMNGTFLRLFSTVVPGEKKQKIMYPTDVAMDDEGHLWVVGRGDSKADYGVAHVVQYKQNGQPVTKFAPRYTEWYPCITVDTHDDKIIVALSQQILIFLPNGSFCMRIFMDHFLVTPYVASDSNGNILLSNTYVQGIQVYNTSSGHALYSFGSIRHGRGTPHGISVDTEGNVFLAYERRGRVDMFDHSGQFVRTVVNVTTPWGVAVGPGGQLVVTNGCDPDNTVTIYPRRMVYP
ncbi:hypothetical protein Bbelb_022980 [Branchiostoma belcheri]|nr:hypothetical protein Bbelb_022980 [Branchiostoma belcheri]